jgi:hypothetical protein
MILRRRPSIVIRQDAISKPIPGTVVIVVVGDVVVLVAEVIIGWMSDLVSVQWSR